MNVLARTSSRDGSLQDRPARGRDRHLVVVYLLLLQFFYSWAWSSSDVLRPLYRRLYQLSLAEAGSAYSAQVAGALAGALLVGAVQHRLGRSATLALIATGCGLCLAAGVLVQGLVTLVVQRVFLGLFMGAVFPVTVGLIVDLYPAGSRGRLASLVDGTYFVAVVALGWTAAAWLDGPWWLLFWPPGAALFIIGLIAFMLPVSAQVAGPNGPAPRMRDLFRPDLRRRTVSLIALIAANACGHQAFTGWLTVYLDEVQRASPEVIAIMLSAQYSGSILGCFAWGYVVDHWGRRSGAIGLTAAALFVAVFVLAPWSIPAKQLAIFGFGVSFAAVVTLGPWLAELYSPALRAPATALFQWGRCVSLIAPPASGLVAQRLGLPAVMVGGAIAFLASALIWRRLPETHIGTGKAGRSTFLSASPDAP